MFLVFFGRYTDVLSVSMRFSEMFCIYERIKIGFGDLLDNFENCFLSGNTFEEKENET